LEVVAASISITPKGAKGYVYVGILYQEVLELRRDISRFWNNGWRTSIRGKN
jgi:hypothetical protein